MSQYTVIRVKLPDIKTPFVKGSFNYSNAATKRENIAMIREIKRKYGNTISRWGEVFQIPDGVINAFIATESGGIMQPPNEFRATGLMQVTPNAIWESARKWKSVVKSDMPALAQRELQTKFPEIFTSKAAQPTAAQANKVLRLLQNDANFNIMAGTLILRWLLERFSTVQTGGQLNKVMVAYNAGAYLTPLVCNLKIGKQCEGTIARPDLNPIDSTALATSPRIPSESRGYLLKMLGKDGFLSLIYIDKAI